MSMITKTLITAAAGLVLATSAFAQSVSADRDQACRAEAHRQVLEGEALVNFMAQCNSGQISLKDVSPKATRTDPAALLSGEAKVNANRAVAAE